MGNCLKCHAINNLRLSNSPYSIWTILFCGSYQFCLDYYRKISEQTKVYNSSQSSVLWSCDLLLKSHDAYFYRLKLKWQERVDDPLMSRLSTDKSVTIQWIRVDNYTTLPLWIDFVWIKHYFLLTSTTKITDVLNNFPFLEREVRFRIQKLFSSVLHTAYWKTVEVKIYLAKL